jgi:hypothetical protein
MVQWWLACVGARYNANTFLGNKLNPPRVSSCPLFGHFQQTQLLCSILDVVVSPERVLMAQWFRPLLYVYPLGWRVTTRLTSDKPMPGFPLLLKGFPFCPFGHLLFVPRATDKCEQVGEPSTQRSRPRDACFIASLKPGASNRCYIRDHGMALDTTFSGTRLCELASHYFE